MNESDLSSATHSSQDKESDKEKDKVNPDDMIEIVIDLDDPKPPNTIEMSEKQNCTLKSCSKNCCAKIQNFYCGKSLSYFSCVLMYGCFPAIIIFISFAIISGVVWGVLGGSVGMIVGITFLCMSLLVPLLFIHLAALYAYCYPSNDIGSLGYCCFCCKRN